MADETKPEDTVTTPAPEAPPVADPARGDIDALATEFGFSPTNFASFKDVDSARTAIKLAVEMGANHMAAAPAPVNLPADRFSKPQAEAAPEPVSQYKSIDYKALGLEDDDAAAKALRLQEQQIKANDDRIRAMETRLQEQQRAQQQQAEQAVMHQADEIISGFASPRYGTSVHRTQVQEANMDHLIRMAGTLRRNSGGMLPLKACLNQARLLDEGTTTALSTTLPEKKAANSELNQGGTPALSAGVPKLKMTEKFTANPEVRARLGLPPLSY